MSCVAVWLGLGDGLVHEAASSLVKYTREKLKYRVLPYIYEF